MSSPWYMKNKKLPQNYLGHCDFDHSSFLDYPEPVQAIAGQWEMIKPAFRDFWFYEKPSKQYIAPSPFDFTVPYSTHYGITEFPKIVGYYGPKSIGKYPGFIRMADLQFNDFGVYWILGLLAAGFFTAAGAYLYTWMMEADTEAERQDIKSDAYRRYTDSSLPPEERITEEEYKFIVGMGSSGGTGQLIDYLISKYGKWILGALALVIILWVVKK